MLKSYFLPENRAASGYRFTSLKCYLLILISIICNSQLPAQVVPLSVKFDKIGLEHGLSQSAVNAIVQDHFGFIWFGTQDGLNRYDGYNLKVFKNNPADSSSISDNTIWSLLSDSKGNLWIGTMLGGLNLYNFDDNSFSAYQHDKNDSNSISGNYVTALCEDSKGFIWIGTDEGLNHLDPNTGKFKRFFYDEKNNNSLSSNAVWDIKEDNSGNIWIATGRGLNKLRVQNNQQQYSPADFIRIEDTPGVQVGIGSSNIHTLFIEDDERIWVGTWGRGLFLFDQKTHTYNHYFYNSKDPYSITSNSIQSVLRDKKNVLWIATYDAGLLSYDPVRNGFNRHSAEALRSLYEDRSGIIYMGTFASGVKTYDRQKNFFIHYYDDPLNPDDMKGNTVLAIIEDSSGELWVGTYGSGLNRFDAERKKVTSYVNQPDNPNSLSNNKIIALTETSDGKIWIGTEGDGLNSFDKVTGRFKHYRHNPSDLNSISYNEISTLYEDSKGNLWVGTNRGSVDIISPRGEFSHYYHNPDDPGSLIGASVTSVYEDQQGNIWVGTIRGGLHRFDPETKIFERCFSKSGQSDNVFCISEKEGYIWTGTVGGGLKRYDPQRKEYKSYTTQEGLSNDNVFGVHPDDSGFLWISTNNGLSRFDPLTEVFTNYDVRDGLQSNEFNQGAHFRSPSGELFFGGMNGVNAFYPERINTNEYVPPVYIVSFTVFDSLLPESYIKGGRIELKYSENFFSFDFVALNYTSPEKNMYAYKLEGFDKDWHIVPASHRYGSYTNLDPGEYILHIKGSNNDGIWSESKSPVSIIIHPPFWMTWWFRSILIFSLLISIGFSVRHLVLKKVKIRMRRMEQEVALERERLRIARDMHDDLGSRLTEIRLLSEMGQKKETGNAAVTLKEISEASRDIISTFSEIVWSVNPQNDTVENLVEYIGQYAMDYLSKLEIKCRLNFPDEFPKVTVPSEVRHNIFMAAKEVLNNSVKYSSTDIIYIEAEIKNDNLILTITDKGKGFEIDSPGKGGNGLVNIKKRLEQINGNCEIESRAGEGTKTKLSVFLLNKN